MSADADADVRWAFSVDDKPEASARGFLKSHRVVAHALPEPEVEWTVNDVPAAVGDVIHRLAHDNIVENAGWEHDHNKARERNVWRTSPVAAHWIDEHVEDRRMTPCGHSGVRCIEAGETYTCLEESCEETFDREAAEEVLG